MSLHEQVKLQIIKQKLREDFQPFFDAMIDEMAKHYEEKGDSWKQDEYTVGYYHRYSSMPSIPIRKPMIEFLTEALKEEFKEWEQSLDIGELVDIANFCGMIWSKVKKVLVLKEGKT